MFVGHELELDLSIASAQARLADLARAGALGGAADTAYQAGLDGLIRVGPFGSLAGASKLIRIRFLDPVYREQNMTLGMRWEATGPTRGLFPVLDADISVTPAGDQATRLALAGCYRPPLGRLGAGLDRALLNRVATATIRALLREVADALLSPAMTVAEPQRTAIGPAPPSLSDPELSG